MRSIHCNAFHSIVVCAMQLLFVHAKLYVIEVVPLQVAFDRKKPYKADEYESRLLIKPHPRLPFI